MYPDVPLILDPRQEHKGAQAPGGTKAVSRCRRSRPDQPEPRDDPMGRRARSEGLLLLA